MKESDRIISEKDKIDRQMSIVKNTACTTHHYACDCREEKHAKEISSLRQKISELEAVDVVAMVKIPLAEYVKLKEDREWLECLNQAGVDNWGGISEAFLIKEENEL